MITKILLFVFAVGLVAGENPFVDYPPEAKLDKFVMEYEGFFVRKECTQTGLMCENCTTPAYCYRDDDGEWIKEIEDDCGDGTTCRDGMCTANNHLPECEEALAPFVFDCKQSGLFPHPYNCKKYFICIPEEGELKPIEFTCAINWSYDPLRGRCRNKLPGDTCITSPVPQCNDTRTQGPVPGNPNLYYACLPNADKVLLPVLRYCPNDYEFFDDDCRDPTPIGMDNGRCIKIGNFSDPANCRSYKECTTIGQPPLNRTCSLNYKFIPKNSKCETFPCNCY